MKAFKILDLDDNRMIGYVVAEDIDSATATWEKECDDLDKNEDFDSTNLEEMTREEFEAIQWVDETAEPNEDGEYPISPMDYAEEVENVTEAYVIEFDH